MKKLGILGKKIAMTQIPNENRNLIPVTAVWVGENVVSQIKNKEKDGYDSCQISFEKCKKKINNSKFFHLKKNEISPHKFIKEIKEMNGFKEGDVINSSMFKEGMKVKVTGISKGKGTSGVIKRYGFKIGNMSHGAGYPHRLIGSMGGGRGTNPGIYKGKKMPGRMGNKRNTKISLIKKIDENKEIIFISGSIPGPKKGLIIIKTYK